MSGQPSVCVIICAYTLKRWAALNASIQSALRQPETSEVIVVSDHDADLLERLSTLAGITAVANRFRRGLSGARNTGVYAATSDIVAFLDDDATAHAGWLGEMLAAFEDPAVVAVGGSAHPVWPDGRAPACLPPELLWVVGCTYVGQPVKRAQVRNIIGCSMAFRRDAVTEVGGFDVNTGRVGTIPLGAEETELCIRLSQLDPTRRIIFEPLSRVSHTVSRDRLSWRYLRRRSFFEGVSKAALSRDLGAKDALSSERSYVRRVLPAGAARHLLHGRPLGAFAIMLSLCAASIGYVYAGLSTVSSRSPLPARQESLPG